MRRCSRIPGLRGLASSTDCWAAGNNRETAPCIDHTIVVLSSFRFVQILIALEEYLIAGPGKPHARWTSKLRFQKWTRCYRVIMENNPKGPKPEELQCLCSSSWSLQWSTIYCSLEPLQEMSAYYPTHTLDHSFRTPSVTS